MKKLLYFLFIFPLFLNAQNDCKDGHSESKPADVSGKNVDGNSELIPISFKNNSIKGSPFAFKDWCKCEVVTLDNSVTNYDKVQFNLEKNQVIVYNNGISTAIPTSQITSFKVTDGNSTRWFTSIDKSNFIDNTENKLYEVFSTGNYLIKETTKNIQVSSDDSQKMYYKKRTSYYVLNKSGKYVKTKLNKKNIMKLLKDKESDIKTYISKNKLSFNEKDIPRILEYYYTLS
ncbi:MAG: hypothetical protein COA67_05005 [Lutibacter sp.]|nr:MAG: hypothetical protein COA67_05005 [Lutibacter sp.]